ncbi:hypothetical protein C8F01DRAFT_1260224 [Mycena amicta]|nr:hypothetical protein C8F01DRAFT_1260224 [Mycena amicta]
MSLLPDPDLPCGDATHSILNSGRDEQFRASVLGRVLGIIAGSNEKYIILAPVNHSGLEDDFNTFIDALRAVEDRYAIGHIKRVESWVSPSALEPAGLVYTHVTRHTSVTTHACTTREDWIELPGDDLGALAIGAVVFCVGSLLRIQTTVFQSLAEDEGNVLGLVSDPSSPIGLGTYLAGKHYIFKASFIARMHRRTEQLSHCSPEMDEFLATGSLPGPGDMIPAREHLPVHMDA